MRGIYYDNNCYRRSGLYRLKLRFSYAQKYPDYRIVCLDCLTYAGNLSTLAPVMDNPNFRFVKESITDREAVYKLFEEEHPDMVVNFAAESHVDRSIENPEVFLIQISRVLLCLWTLAESTESSVIIRFPPMRFTAICRLIDQTFFYRGNSDSHKQSVFIIKSRCRPSCACLLQNIRLARNNKPLFKQLRSLSFP